MTGEGLRVPFDSWSPRQEDWLLTLLVRVANDAGLELGLTLTVGGIIVSGDLIGGPVYFRELTEAIKTAGDEGAIALADGISLIAKNIYESGGRDEAEDIDPIDVQSTQDEDDDESPPPSYLHMRNAYLFSVSGDRMPVTAGALWRARLSAIDSVILGKIGLLDQN